MDDAHKLAAEWGVPVAVALMAVGVRMLLTSEKWTLLGVVRGLAVGAFVGLLAALWVWDMQRIELFWLFDVDPLTVGQKGAIIGLCAMMAEDLVVAAILIGRKLREDPVGILTALFSRGKKP